MVDISEFTKKFSAFTVTDEWQEVPPGAVLPNGVQVEMNMTTGKQRVRKYPKDETAELDEEYEKAEAESKPNGHVKSGFDEAKLNLRALAGRQPPPRVYAWDPWIPARMTTLLHGDGGTGKSLLAQQLVSAYALGVEMFGGATEGKPAFMLAGEDDHDEIWRRQVDICRRLGVSMYDVAGKINLFAVPHLDITIAECSDVGALKPTAGFLARFEVG
jgi:AAA domain